MMSLPWRSSARALFNTSKAVSVPSRDMRLARRSSYCVAFSMMANRGIIPPGGWVGRYRDYASKKAGSPGRDVPGRRDEGNCQLAIANCPVGILSGAQESILILVLAQLAIGNLQLKITRKPCALRSVNAERGRPNRALDARARGNVEPASLPEGQPPAC